MQECYLRSATFLTANNVTIFANPARYLTCERRHGYSSPIRLHFHDNGNEGQWQEMPVLTIQKLTIHRTSSWRKPILHILLENIIVRTTMIEHNTNGTSANYLDYTNTILQFLKKLPIPPTKPDIYPKLGSIQLRNLSFEIYYGNNNKQRPSSSLFLPWSKTQATSSCNNQYNPIEEENQDTSNCYCYPQDVTSDAKTMCDNVLCAHRTTCSSGARKNLLLISKLYVPQVILDRLFLDTTHLVATKFLGGIEQMDIPKVLEESLLRGLVEDLVFENIRKQLNKTLLALLLHDDNNNDDAFAHIRKLIAVGKEYIKASWPKIIQEADSILKKTRVLDDTSAFFEGLRKQLAISEENIKNSWSVLREDAILKNKNFLRNASSFFDGIRQQYSVCEKYFKNGMSEVLKHTDTFKKKFSSFI